MLVLNLAKFTEVLLLFACSLRKSLPNIFTSFFFDHHMMHSEGVMGNRDNECSAQGSSVNGMDDETKTSSPYLEMGCYSADSSSWRPYPVW